MVDETTGLSAMGTTFAERAKAREQIEAKVTKTDAKQVDSEESAVEDKAVKKATSKRKGR